MLANLPRCVACRSAGKDCLVADQELGTPREEFPSPHSEPKATAPGTDPIAREIIQRRRDGEVEQGSEGQIEEPAGLKEALDSVDPAEAGSRVQQDPGSPKPAPEG